MPVAAAQLTSIITADVVQGVFDEILAIVPVVIPAAIGYLGVRKGISFVMGMLRSA